MFTIKEAAAYYGIGIKFLRRCAENGESKFGVICGNRWMIIKDRFEKYLQSCSDSFLNEVCHMRLEIAYQRYLEERTSDETDKEQERDNHIEELYNRLLELCNEEGKAIFKEYANEVAYRECDDTVSITRWCIFSFIQGCVFLSFVVLL